MTSTEVISPQKNEQESTIENNGEQIVAKSIRDIEALEKSVIERTGVEPGSAEAVRETDSALVYIAEETIKSPQHGVEEKNDALDDVVIETALEIEQGIRAFDTPVATMEDDGFGSDLNEIVTRLHTSHATLPSGHEAAPLVMRAIDELTEHPIMSEPGEVEYVSSDSADVQPTGILDKIKGFARPKRAETLEPVQPEYSEVNNAEKSEATAQELLGELESRIANNKDSYGNSPQRFKEIHGNDFFPAMPYQDLLDSTQWVVADNTLKPDVLDKIFTTAYEMKVDDQVLKEEPESTTSIYARKLLESAAKANDIMAIRSGEESSRQGYDTLRREAEKSIDVSNPEDRNKWAIILGYKDALHMFDSIQTAIDSDAEHMDEHLWGELYAIESMTGRYPDSEIRTRANDYLNKLGIDDWQASRILQGMQGRIQPASKPMRTNRLIEELMHIKEATDRIGQEGVRTLHDELGIVNIAELNPGQQARMVRFANSDPTLFEELQSKDVCVIIRDPTSDYNGALEDTIQNFETRDDSSLVFEPSTLEELEGIVRRLSDSGVRPSAYVLAGHGHPGSMTIGDIKLTTSNNENKDQQMIDVVSYSDASIDTLLRLMKPDRDGVRNVIFCSCSQGQLYDDYDSTLTTVAKRANEIQPGGDIHVYGTIGENNIRNADGNLFDDYTKFMSTKTDIEQQTMTEVHVGVNGTVYMTHNNQEVYLPMFDRRGVSNIAQRESLDEVEA